MMMKNVRLSGMIVMICLVVIAFAGCAKPPTEELADAKLEFQKATEEGAQQYASDQYMSAEAALNEANQLMEQRKYKEARQKAREALRLAREARAGAVDGQNAANRDAQEMYDLALAAVNSANEAGGYSFDETKAQMEAANATLMEAKAAYDSGDYAAAKQLAESALVQAQKVEAMANQVYAQKQQEAAQQAAQRIEGPAATPRAYPTEHVVIKGETLWWIAEYRQIYDDPFQWPLIYKANRDRIKDPDLIYPDQVFQITRAPELTDEMIKEAIKFSKNRGAWSLYDGK